MPGRDLHDSYHRHRRKQLVPAVLAVAVALSASTAAAAVWPVDTSGSGSARAGALAQAAAPAATVSGTLTKSVRLSWPAVAGATVYTVRRYDASTGLLQSVGGDCTAPTTNGCTDTGLPPALTWRYSVEATHGAWTGGEGPATTVSTCAALQWLHDREPEHDHADALPRAGDGRRTVRGLIRFRILSG